LNAGIGVLWDRDRCAAIDLYALEHHAQHQSTVYHFHIGAGYARDEWVLPSSFSAATSEGDRHQHRQAGSRKFF